MNSTLPTRTLQPPGTSTWNITTRFLLLPRKSITPKRQRSASRTPTPPRPRISRPITTQVKTTQRAVATTVRDRVLAGAWIAAVTEAGIVAAGAVGDVVADAIAADHRVVPADAIFLLRSTRRHKAANPVDTIIAAADSLRRVSGGLPRWLPADVGAEVEAAPSGETADAVGESPAAGDSLSEPLQEPVVNHVEAQRNDVELNEDQVAALASSFVEAKQEETSDAVEADAIVGGAEFDEEEEEETEAEETIVTEVSQLSAEEAEEVEAGRA